MNLILDRFQWTFNEFNKFDLVFSFEKKQVISDHQF